MFSLPPRCSQHTDDPDAWFEGVISAMALAEVTESMRSLTLGMSHGLYRVIAVEGNDVGRALYSDYKNRVDPSKTIAFSFTDIVYFSLAAAASGVIGNFAYDVIKSAIKNVSQKHRNHELVESFEMVVRETRYEQLRIEQHSDGSSKIEATAKLETEVERRYCLIVLKNADEE